MKIERTLHIISLLSAWQRDDEEAVRVLIRDGGPSLYMDLIQFSLVIIEQNTAGNPQIYLDWLATQARAVQAREASDATP